MADPTLDATIQAALEPYARLADLGRTIEDEWSYVGDLETAWTTRLAQVAAARGTESTPPEVVAAVDEAAAELAAITDPHRAIDWLSTYPQVVLIALGERP
jgi:hypothetical protein